MRFVALSLVLVSLPVLGTAEELPIQPLLEQYCYQCHDEDSEKGDVRLDHYFDSKQLVKDRKLWLKVLEQLETREMPTKGDLPTEEEYEEMIAFVDETVNHIDWSKLKHPGHVTLPRLTKEEYNRTVNDLLGIDLRSGERFSEDGEGKSGFTNDRDALFITGSQMEKYFEAAERTFEAVAALNSTPIKRSYEAEEMFMTETKTRTTTWSDDSIGYALNRGQMTLYDSVEVPHDGFYRFTVRTGSLGGPASGILRLDDQVAGEYDVEEQRVIMHAEVVAFVEKGAHQMAWNIKGFNRARQQNRKTKPEDYTKLPDEAFDIIAKKSLENVPLFPRPEIVKQPLLGYLNDWDNAEKGAQRAYEWLRLHGPNGDPNELERFRRYVKERSEGIPALKKHVAAELNVSVKEIEQRFASGNVTKMEDRRSLMEMAEDNIVVKPGQLYIDRIEVTGPILPEGADEALVGTFTSALGSEDFSKKELRKLLVDFLPRAFRRPVKKSEIDKFIGIHESSDSLEQTLAAVLISPEFLFRAELAPEQNIEGAYALSDWSLASRLSYFLWGTMPDETLFDLAEKGRLSQPDVLKSQVDRMLSSPKSDSFFQEFPSQWLGYSALGKTTMPDDQLFPDFTPDLAAAMNEQAKLWFAEVFRNNRSIFELVDTHQTYLNADLARHYDLPAVRGEELKLVSLADENQHRGGILGMGSILTATSTPVRTSPVLRGVWVSERLLGDPPGEPPADAGELPGNAGQKRGKTLREELEQHRDRPDCAGCHDKIDPIGFGLEQFDATGRFRDKENGKPIDATGTLPDGTSFAGINDLKDWLLNKRRDDFATNLTERLLSYALGRELQVYDTPEIERIVEQILDEDASARSLVREVALSYPFTHQHPSRDLE